MRDRVFMKLGAKEQPLLPAFQVVDAFEDRFTGLLEHLQDLMAGKAKIHVRAYLICEGLKAAQPEIDWDLNTVMERMFDRGYWHEDLIFEEQEFIERLLYTPDQFTAKKQKRAEEAEKQMEIYDQLLNVSSD